jgi:hypothetical protein
VNINLKPTEELRIDGKVFVVQPDPNPDMINRPYIELGGSGQVAQLLEAGTTTYHALKIFNNPEKSLIKQTNNLEKYNIAKLPGLLAAQQRSVINPNESQYSDIIRRHSFLQYSVLMPWIGGYTWFEILSDNKGESKIPVFNKETSLFYASQLANVLASLEAKGYAHCDICSNNIILDFTNPSVQLIDIEDMYIPGAERRGDFIGGQNGYAHPNRPLGHQWIKESDRFGGGMLICEILTWCDPKIRAASDAESYAVPAELCKDTNKYNLMRHALSQHGSVDLAGLFDRLWNSKSLESCPTLREWEQQVNLLVKTRGVSKPALDGLSQFGADGRIRIQRKQVNLTGQDNGQKRPVSSTRKTVNMAVPLRTPLTDSGTLPAFRPKVNWRTAALWIFIFIVAIVILIAVITVIGSGSTGYVSNPPVPIILPTQTQISVYTPVINNPPDTVISPSDSIPATEIPEVRKTCSGAPPIRVEIGDTARVTYNSPTKRNGKPYICV